jgi:AcrR family transcriptional regulator
MATLSSAKPATGLRERKAAATRRRLLDAARDLMAIGGPESVTIGGLTTRAEIGLGTFYNYFDSRDAIIDAVIYDIVESLGQRLDLMSAGIDDAAEVYSFSLRHMMNTAFSDPVWGWFLVRLGTAHEGLVRALGPRAARDIQYGIDTGRFALTDSALASAMTFGSLLSVMRIYLESDERPDDPSSVYAEHLLRMVGIPVEEAGEIARRPLPELPDPPKVPMRIARRDPHVGPQ